MEITVGKWGADALDADGGGEQISRDCGVGEGDRQRRGGQRQRQVTGTGHGVAEGEIGERGERAALNGAAALGVAPVHPQGQMRAGPGTT